MNSNSVCDLSLYELALSVEPLLPVLPASPATLKSMVGNLVDFVTEQDLPAIVWAKLPRGDAWQSELERCHLGSKRGTMYIFSNQRDEVGDEAGMVSAMGSTIAAGTSPSETGASLPLVAPMGTDTNASMVSIELASESLLRREYFVLVWSSQFRGLLLAQRSRPASKTAALETEVEGAVESKPTEDGTDRRQPLTLLFSFDANLIEQVLTGLSGAMRQVLSAATGTTDTSLGAEIVAHWQSQLATIPLDAIDLSILGRFFAGQIQRQEEVWQRNAVYRKQAEHTETLQQQNEDLLQMLRLKDDFLNNVGQELRTPLTTIKTALTLLNSPTIKLPQRQRYMELIAKECDRQSSLITSLLDLVQLDQMVDQTDLQPLRLCEILPGVVSTYQPLAEEKGVMLAYTVPEDLPPVSCMSNWLKQIVINLLHNGIKFTPRGGQVWVRAKQQDDYIQIEIRDTGIGIATAEIPKIFERFYRVRQTTEDSGGAGLGLTIVQQLLIHCGGSISVKSKLGEGSTFHVLLPIYK